MNKQLFLEIIEACSRDSVEFLPEERRTEVEVALELIEAEGIKHPMPTAGAMLGITLPFNGDPMLEAFEAGFALGKAMEAQKNCKLDLKAACADVLAELALLAKLEGKPIGQTGRVGIVVTVATLKPKIAKAVAKHRLNDIWLGRVLGKIALSDFRLSRVKNGPQWMWRMLHEPNEQAPA